MANDHYGNMLPQGVTSRDQVKEIQRQLNVSGANLTEDGIWGPRTSSAYTAGGEAVSYVPTQYKNYLSEIQTLLQPQKVQYTPTSEEQYLSQIQSALRPGYDTAITQRKAATRANKAEIDADAAARSMSSSTWVTDVKDRQSGYEADDIATMEGQYNAALSSALMNALQTEKANQLTVDQTNAQLAANAQAQALGLAGDFYSQYLASLEKKNTKPHSEPKPEPRDPVEAYLDAIGQETASTKMNNIPTLEELKDLIRRDPAKMKELSPFDRMMLGL